MPEPDTLIPTEFDLELDAERAKRLRRRFMWFCAINLVLSLLQVPSLRDSFRKAVVANSPQMPRQIAYLAFAILIPTALTYLACFIYAWRVRPPRRTMVLLALWLAIVMNSVGMIGSRIAMEISAPIVRAQMIQNFDQAVAEKMAERAATRAAATQNAGEDFKVVVINKGIPSTRQAIASTNPALKKVRSYFAAVNAAKIWALAGFFSVLFGHLIPCLFIPWTFRESLRPAAALIFVNALIIGTDFARGNLSAIWLLAAVAPMLAVVPGAAWCWWRDRRFRRHFQTKFESRSFRKLQHELSDARRVHESLLPKPRTHGPVRMHYIYEPMRQIGGDLLFIFPPSHQHVEDGVSTLSAVVLDVTGHGIAAALTVNRIVGELERLFIEQPDAPPGKVLWTLNRYVYSTLSQHDLYVTAVCLRVDSARDALDYASGGHPTAFLRRADGSIQLLESTATLLGVLDAESFDPEPVSVPFHKGDAVIAYTDGAAEARNSAGDQLGTAGVKHLLSKVAGDGRTPPDWPGEVMRHVLQYRGAPPDDDTLVVAMFRPQT